MYAFDLSLFNAIHSFAGRSVGLDALIVFFGQYVLYILLATLAVLAASAWYSGKRHVLGGYLLAFAGALIARFGAETIIHFFYYRPRPYLALDVPHLLTEASSSFPSGHTIFIFALATGLLSINKRVAYVFFTAGLLVGIARIAAGVHYPSDVLGGALLGILAALLVRAVWRRSTIANM